MKQSVLHPRPAPSDGAFTLLELLLVLAVVAVLLVLLGGAFSSINGKTRQAACLERMRSVGLTILQYPVDHGGDLLPALANVDKSGGTPWYVTLDEENLLIGKPNRSGTWNRNPNSVMTCPARSDLPLWNGNSAGATLHYGANQFPGFLNRTGKPGSSYETLYRARYGYPKLVRITSPHRTFLLGEVYQTYNTWPLDNQKNAYPHPSSKGPPLDGEGMNLFFYDGHAAFFRGKLPVLGDVTSIKANEWSPEESYPFF